MKKGDADGLIALANYCFPDDVKLALYNLFAEIDLGHLHYVTIEGDPQIAEGDDTSIVGVIGVVMLGLEPFPVQWLDRRSTDENCHRQLLLHVAAVEVPQGLTTESFGPPPRTVVAVARIQDETGREASVVFRHPGIEHDRAILVLQKAYEDEIAEAAPPARGN